MISCAVFNRRIAFAFALLSGFAAPTSLANTPSASACVDAAKLDIWSPIEPNRSIERGELLGCVQTRSVDAATLSSAIGKPASAGYDELVIQYASIGPIGRNRRATALVYLPAGGSSPHAIVAVNHGTSGVGPRCGPSHWRLVTDYLALPLVAEGYAVVAPDYFGIGIDDGVSPYLVGEAAAFAILDSVRALQKLRDPRFNGKRLSNELFLLGHSQGGQTSLFAQADYDASLGVKLLGTIAIAPGWGDIRGLHLILGNPKRKTDLFTLFVLMGLYGDMVYRGAPDVATWLTESARAELPALLHEQCFDRLAATIPERWPTQGDLFTRAFISAASRCTFAEPACPGFQPWDRELRANLPGDFASDVPVLMLQGGRDTVVAPYGVACVVDRLRARGTPVSACGYPAADHYDIVQKSFTDILTWMAARQRGETIDVCSARLPGRCP